MMKTLIGIILCLFFLCSCSHSTAALLAIKAKAPSKKNFAIDRHEYQKKLSYKGLRLHISSNATIDVDIKSIANFVKPSDIEQNYTFWPEEDSTQPWAKCSISF